MHEGARRMQRAGIWVTIIGACCGALVFWFQFITIVPMGRGSMNGTGVAIFAMAGVEETFLGAIPGALLCLASWIVEGFAKEPD